MFLILLADILFACGDLLNCKPWCELIGLKLSLKLGFQLNLIIMNFIRHYGSKNRHIHQHMQTYTENKRADKQAHIKEIQI